METIAVKVKRELKVERTLKGRQLLGIRYVPPFDYFYSNEMLPLYRPKPKEGTDWALSYAWRWFVDELRLNHPPDVSHNRPFEQNALTPLPMGEEKSQNGSGNTQTGLSVGTSFPEIL